MAKAYRMSAVMTPAMDTAERVPIQWWSTSRGQCESRCEYAPAECPAAPAMMSRNGMGASSGCERSMGRDGT